MTTQTNRYINIYSFKNVITAFRRFIIPAIAVFIFTGTAVAQDRTLTLDEAIKLGIQNSKVLKLSQARINEAITEYNQAKDRYKPTGTVSFGYNRAEIPANRLDLGPSSFELPKSDNAYLGIATINEVIFGGNKLRYARSSTELLTQVSRLDAENDKDQITYDVIDSYFNLYKVLQSIKVVQQNITTVDQQIKQSQRFFDQGLVTKNDVLRFQLQKANIQLNGIDLETNRKIVNYNLDILLGLPETTQLNIAETDVTNHVLAPLSTYIDTALTIRPDVRQYDLRTKVDENNIKNLRADELPSLVASGSAYYVGISGNPIPKDGNYITPITIGLNVSWNFATLWNNKNKVAQAKVQRDESIINKTIAIDNVKREVNQNYQNYAMAVDKINLLQTSIAQATENNNILTSRYQSNIASATDRADAETLLYQAQINLELAKADAGLAYYNLLKSTGKLNK